MNIHETAMRYKISVKALRRLEKGGLLKFEKGRDSMAKARFLLIRKQQLPVATLLELLDEPGSLFDLHKYRERAVEQINALGPVREQAAPIEVYANIADAATGDTDAAQTLATWLAGILPRDPVTHHWVAVRLLLPLDEGQRAPMLEKITFALMHMRRLESFAGYWESITTKAGRKEIRYFQKRDENFMDL